MTATHPVINAGMLGECRPAVSTLLLCSGEDELYDLQPIKEISRMTPAATSTDPDDPITDRLGADTNCSGASITTFMPLTDTGYIPRVGPLDFRIRDGAVDLVVFAHRLDFGKRADLTTADR